MFIQFYVRNFVPTHLALLCTSLFYLLQSSGVVLHVFWEHNEHAHVFTLIGEFQNLAVDIGDVGKGERSRLMHHLHRLTFILQTDTMT